MKVRKIHEIMLWIIVGSILSTLLFHFRFNNELLLEEMLLIMKSGNSYFLTFVYAEIIILIIGVAIHTISFKKIWIPYKRK